MSLSGELREHVQPRRERLDASGVNDHDREVIARAERLIDIGRSKELGSGKTADVIILDIFPDADEGRWIIKQQTERRGKQQLLGMTFEDELRAQDRAFSIVEEARKQHPEKQFARIPRPYSYVRDEKSSWLIMECIDGETLFERALRTFIASHTDEHSPWTSDQLMTMRKDALVEAAMHAEIINLLPPRYLEEMNSGAELDDEHFIGIALQANRFTRGASKVLSAEQFTALENTMQELHRNGLYHRDLHASNVMIDRENNVVVLDFGAAVIRSRQEVAQGSNVYTIKTEDDDDGTRYRTITDENMLADFAKVARKVK